MAQIRGKQIADNSLDAKKLKSSIIPADVVLGSDLSVESIDTAANTTLVTKGYSDAKVLDEKNRAIAAENVLDDKINSTQGEVDALDARQVADHATALQAVVEEESRAKLAEAAIRDEFATADTNLKSDLLGDAADAYNTFGKVEDVIIANKSAIELSLSTETTNRADADNVLQDNIDTVSEDLSTHISAYDIKMTALDTKDTSLQTEIDALTIKQADDHGAALQAALDAEAAANAYTDAMAQGLMIKEAVRVTTSANLDLSVAVTVIDGINLIEGDRVLVKNQTDKVENGVYVVNVSSLLVRAEDMDAPEEFRKNTFMFVSEGTLLQDTGWVMVVDGAITVGVTPIEFVQFSSAGVIEAGSAITKSGNVLDVQVDASTIEVNANNKLRIKDGGVTDVKIDTVAASKAILNPITGIEATEVQSAVAELNTDINNEITAREEADDLIRTDFAAADAAIIDGASVDGDTLKKLEDKISALDTSSATALATADGNGLTWNATEKQFDVVAGNGIELVGDAVALDVKNYNTSDAVNISSTIGITNVVTTLVGEVVKDIVHLDINPTHVEQSSSDANDTALGTSYVGYERVEFVHDTATNSERITMLDGITLSTTAGVKIVGTAAAYATDLSASFVNRSLVDKGYVDNAISTGVAGGSLNDQVAIEETGGITPVSGMGIQMYSKSLTGITGTAKTPAKVYVNGVKLQLTEMAFFAPTGWTTGNDVSDRPSAINNRLYFNIDLIGFELEAVDVVEITYYI